MSALPFLCFSYAALSITAGLSSIFSAATLLYGMSANYTKLRLQGVAPLAVAAGSQLAAAVVLALPALWWWPANAITVTFLIPLFAVLWGWLFLGEGVSTAMGIGCAVIVIGTALGTGWAERFKR
jgi:hypothetical protein